MPHKTEFQSRQAPRAFEQQETINPHLVVCVMATSDLESVRENENVSALQKPFYKAIPLLIVRNPLLFAVYLLFILIIANVVGRSFGLPHLFRTDSAFLNESNWLDYLLSVLPGEGSTGFWGHTASSPGIWGHVATTLLLITILIGASVKEILHYDVGRKLSRRAEPAEIRDIVVGAAFKYAFFFVLIQIGAVIFRDLREATAFPVMALEVVEAVFGVILGLAFAAICIAVMSFAYRLAYNRWAKRWIGRRTTSWLKKITIQSLWRNSSEHAAWILLYFIAGVLVVAGIFLSLEVVVPGVALCILTILIIVLYFAVSSIRPVWRVPLIVLALIVYSQWSYDPFDIEFPDFAIAGESGDVNLYECPLRIGTLSNGARTHDFECDELGELVSNSPLTRSIAEPIAKDPKAAGEVVKGNGKLDKKTCIIMGAWRARAAGKRLTPEQLEARCDPASAWPTRNVLSENPSLQPAQSQKPKLVVVTASGGAYRAGFWTALVLDELIRRSEETQSLARLTDHIKLLTGASGGMVASAYFAALSSRENWPAPGDLLIKDQLLKDIERSRSADVPHDIAPGKFKTGFPIDRDSLGPVAQQTLQRDIIRSIVPPILPKRALAWSWWHDRGLVLEQQWATLNTTFATLEEGANAGRVPGLILSPMVVDTGQPLLISNLSMEGVVRQSEDAALDFFEMFPKMREKMKLQTAVRMNASFPYISPAVSLPTKPKLRIVDAGYYDNYGVSAAVAWLSQPGMVQELKETTSGVIIIQIRAYSTSPLSADGPDQPDLPYLPEWLTSPITGVSQARHSSMLFRNAKELKLFSLLFCEGFVETVAFENTLGAHDISMSWYLRQDELDRMEAELTDPDHNEYNALVFEELEAIWQSDQTRHPGCKETSSNRLAAGRMR